jgi:cellulose biosynthesis protein BcsQ
VSIVNSKLSGEDSLSGFGERLKDVFGHIQNKEIASRLGVSKPAITGYLQGRVPSADRLIEIAEFTGCNLHWLLTGIGPKRVVYESAEIPDHAKTLLFHCSKGGVGTSTSALLTAVGLANRGYKTLLVDNFYGSCTLSTFYELLKDFKEETRPRAETVNSTDADGIMFFSTPVSGLDLVSFNRNHQSILVREKIRHLEIIPREVQTKYSIVVVDAHSNSNPFNSTHPFMTLLLREAKVFIPFEPYNSDAWSLRTTLEHINAAQRYSKDVEFLGLFVNNYDPRLPISVALRGELELLTGDRLLHSTIHRATDLWDIMTKGLDKFYKTKSKITRDYSALVTEILEMLESANQVSEQSRRAS